MTITTEYNIDDKVWDLLTRKWATIIGISYEIGRKGPNDPCDNVGSIGYWLDNSYVSGGRFSHEITH